MNLICGVSGAGKTRVIFEYLSEHFGAFFVANTHGNGGSLDVQAMVSAVERKVALPPNHGDLPAETRQQNGEIATPFFEVLLFVRLSAIVHLKELVPGITPYQMLILQAFPEYFFGVDVFNNLFQDFSSSKVSPDSFKDLVKKDPVSSGSFVVFMDEAQELVSVCRNSFSSSKDNGLRPLLSRLARAFSERKRTIFSGYGAEMNKVLENPSMLGKNIEESLSLDGYLDPKVAWDCYVSHYLPKADEQEFKEKIFPELKGRCRFFEAFLVNYLEMWEKAGGGHVSLEESFAATYKYLVLNGNKSLLSHLQQLPAGDFSSADFTDKIASFRINGTIPAIPEQAATLVEKGLALLDGLGTPLEPLFLAALCEYFDRNMHQHQLYTLLSTDGSVAGFSFETLSMLSFLRKLEFAQPGSTLASLLGLAAPEKSFLDRPFKLVARIPKLTKLHSQQDSGNNLDDYLKSEQAQEKYLFHAPSVGDKNPDWVTVVLVNVSSDEKAEDWKRVAISAQTKLYKPGSGFKPTWGETEATTKITVPGEYVGILRILVVLAKRAGQYNKVCYPNVNFVDHNAPQTPEAIVCYDYNCLVRKAGIFFFNYKEITVLEQKALEHPKEEKGVRKRDGAEEPEATEEDHDEEERKSGAPARKRTRGSEKGHDHEVLDEPKVEQHPKGRSKRKAKDEN